jgi:predicted MPP superfamily phosphohydrolase
LLSLVAVVLVLVGLVHFYLWKRLVRDSMTGRWKRRVGALVAGLLALLVPATLIGARSEHFQWLAWPGFMWIALMFYLLVTLVPLEIPRLALVLLWRRRRRTEKAEKAAVTGARTVRTDEAAVVPAVAGTLMAGSNDDAGAATDKANSKTATSRTTDGDNVPRNNPPSHKATSETTDADPAGSDKAAHEKTAGKNADGEKAAGKKADGEKARPESGVERRLVLARGMAIFAGLTAAGITGYGVKTALGPPQLDRFVMPLKKLPRGMDGTRLALVSDIHLGPLTGTRHLGRIVDLINSVNADIVCVVGDLVDGSVAELGRFAQPLQDIESKRGAYFVTGNHEYYSGFAPWVEEVASLGVRPLRNERVELDGLDLAGVNDLGGAQFGDGPDFARALGDRDTARPVVLMAHQPVVARQAAPFGVDLQVSGHTHGGQMAPFNLVVKLQQPVVSGFGEVDGVPVYVTNGAGFWGPPVRVGAPPQVTLIELRTA